MKLVVLKKVKLCSFYDCYCDEKISDGHQMYKCIQYTQFRIVRMCVCVCVMASESDGYNAMPFQLGKLRGHKRKKVHISRGFRKWSEYMWVLYVICG